jgi:hypothetical protein
MQRFALQDVEGSLQRLTARRLVVFDIEPSCQPLSKRLRSQWLRLTMPIHGDGDKAVAIAGVEQLRIGGDLDELDSLGSTVARRLVR